MHKTLLIALVLGAGALSASAALPKVSIKKPALTADATGVKVTKPAVEVTKSEGPSAADKIAEAKMNADAAVSAAKQGVEDKVAAAKDAAAAKVTDATDAAVEAAKSASTPTAPTKPSVEVTKPSATLSAEGLKVTKPAFKLKK